MYDSVFTILENFNNEMIKNKIKITQTILNIRQDPSNWNFDEYRRLRQNENKILNNTVNVLKSEDCKVSDYALRLNLNDFLVYKSNISYQSKTFNFQKISITELLIKIYEIISINSHVKDPFDQVSSYKTILDLFNSFPHLKITLIIFNEHCNVYFPIYIN